MFLATTAMALSLLAAPPEPGAGPSKPQAKVELETRVEKPLHRFCFGVRLKGARLKAEGDVERNVPFRLDLPLGKFIQMRFTRTDQAPSMDDLSLPF